MKIDRRAFLRAAAAGTMAGTATVARSEPRQFPLFDQRSPEAFWRSVRELYPLSREIAYFNTGGLGPTPRPVWAVVSDATQRLQEKSEHGHASLAGVRTVVANFLGVEPDEIAFVRNATEGNAMVAAGLALGPGDEVIIDSHAHPGGSYAWLHQQALRGIVVKVFEPSTTSHEETVARLSQLLTSRTRAIQVSHITAPTGIVLPVAAIGGMCEQRKIWFHVDGAQSAGMVPLDLRTLHCDSFATSGHKWLGAPHETGIFWIRKERLDAVAPILVGAYSGEPDAMPGRFRLAPTAVRFEYGTRNSAAILGVAEAVRFQEQIGRERIEQRIRLLSTQVREGLTRLSGVEILTPKSTSMSAAIISFRTAAVPFDRMFSRLLGEYRIRCRPVTEQGLNALRVSTHVFNSPEECAALVSAVEKIVRTP